MSFFFFLLYKVNWKLNLFSFFFCSKSVFLFFFFVVNQLLYIVNENFNCFENPYSKSFIYNNNDSDNNNDDNNNNGGSNFGYNNGNNDSSNN